MTFTCAADIIMRSRNNLFVALFYWVKKLRKLYLLLFFADVNVLVLLNMFGDKETEKRVYLILKVKRCGSVFFSVLQFVIVTLKRTRKAQQRVRPFLYE